MAKNVVVITGSPRKDGNSELMAEAFCKAAETKGHSVQCFAAGKLKIGGCHACNTCFTFFNSVTRLCLIRQYSFIASSFFVDRCT